ncbi:hypothetical protein FSP39_003164 [Pinctada imbricata]|uniref:Carrier domain-containing protein n=1 Tax=Pinctada imbricata TaxID=66713 RepID=A0AA88XV90_PINIB|nr:hypothetical protein FSP39_003164 [Pinctada imbricata]
MLSIIKIGHAFLPLPMDYPLERIAFTMHDSNVTTVVTTRDVEQSLQSMSSKIKVSALNTTKIFGEEVVILRVSHQAEVLTDELACPNIILPSNTAYVMYTSGSTGKPKGVSVPQNAVSNLAYAQIYLWDLNENDIIGQFASIGFDATISEIFTALISGATLAIFSEKERLGHEFISAINKMQINTITLPPSVLNIYGPDDMPKLQKVVTAGEACTVSTAMKWTSGTNIRFFNAYGPTETTVCATCYEFNVSPDNEEVNQELPIGKAIPGAYVCLLDDFQQPVPPDVIGEIYVGGKGLSNGYIGHAKHFNEKKFIQNPFCSSEMLLYKTGDHAFQDSDGNITFVGRLDDMVKIRGQRVDLAEIENILIQHPKVEIAVVVVNKCKKSNEVFIAAYVAPTFIYLSELKEYLVKVLPRYMIPTFISKLEKDQFPLTLSGKIDRKALERDESVHERDPVSSVSKSHLNETQLAISKLWCKVLNMDESMVYTFHRQSSFSELGGNSLQLVLLQRAFQDDLGINLSFTDIGTADTIEEFADVVKRRQDANRKQGYNQHINDEALRKMIIEDSILQDHEVPHHARRGSVQFQHFRSFHHKSDMKYPKNVLISGVTGFLGAYLLTEILEQTNAHVCCMVRETTEARGLGRIRENMRRYNLWKFEYSQRIAVVISDLSQPKLGVAPDIYKELTQVVDAVVMNAAQMNFNTGYEDHRTANVQSTKEFISFAMTGVQKRIFTTSSLGVFLFPKADDPPQMVYYEDDFLDDPLQIAGGYGRSKWASEKLILQALDYLPGGAIFRPARISGCSTDGYGPKNDLFASTILGMKRLGCYPDMDFPYDLTPVDYVAKAMIEIVVKICNDKFKHEKIYHLFNQHTMPFNKLFDGMGLQGYPLQEWRQKLLKAPEENKELIPLTPFFMSPFWDRSPTWPIFDTSNTDSMISDSTKRILRPSSELLKVYKNYFEA